MKSFRDVDEISIYKIGFINNKGEVNYNGNLKFTFSVSPTGFVVEIDSKVKVDNYNNSYNIRTVFYKEGNIKDMVISGMLNNNEYQLTCKSAKKKLNFNFKTMGEEKNHSQSIPNKYFESNNLMFILIPLLDNRKDMLVDVLNPTTAIFAKTHISKIESLDYFKLSDKEFKCDRYKISAEGSNSQSQFFLYCKDTGRLLKAICNNVLFEIQEIIK